MDEHVVAGRGVDEGDDSAPSGTTADLESTTTTAAPATTTTTTTVAPVTTQPPTPKPKPKPKPKPEPSPEPAPPPPTTEAPPEPVSNCDPNYSGGCVPVAPDVDCEGGSGNGPPTWRVQSASSVPTSTTWTGTATALPARTDVVSV